MLHFFSHVLVQKPSPKSKPCTLPEICLTYDIPLLMKGRWPRPRNRLKRFQTVKQGGTKKTHIFIQLHTPTGLRCEVVIFCVFPFWTQVLIFFWKAIIVFLSLWLASIWTEGQKPPQDILWKQHAAMHQKSCRPIVYILPGCCFLHSFGWAFCCNVVYYTLPVTIGCV